MSEAILIHSGHGQLQFSAALRKEKIWNLQWIPNGRKLGQIHFCPSAVSDSYFINYSLYEFGIIIVLIMIA